MSCYHPSFIQRRVKSFTGEVETKFLGGIKNCLECNSSLREKYDSSKELGFLPRVYDSGYYYDFIPIPCGKCIGCRIDYSRSWADRLTYHSLGKEDCSYFITLTYDDEHIENLPFSDNYGIHSLDYSHMDNFIKGLRNRFRDAHIDYFYSGEYGDSSMRCHFHMICYNLFIPDLKFWKLDNEGQPIYTSDIIHSLWKQGICSISSFAWLNAAYTASYVEKKRDGRALCEYTAVGLEPEKARMSRRPGIAFDFYQDNFRDIWQNNGLDVDRSVNSSGHLGIPRYFRKLAMKGEQTSEPSEDYYLFLKWQERMLEQGNVLNELNLKNSSFDLNRVREYLLFQEREILSSKEIRKL